MRVSRKETLKEFETAIKMAPGFVWIVDVRAAPFLHLSGRDKYENGKWHILIKLLSLFPVVDAKEKEIDQGALLRYLGK